MTPQKHGITVWMKFCQRYSVVEHCVPLFEADAGGIAAHRLLGREASRPVLKRSAPTESMALVEPENLITDWESGISSSSSWAEMLVRVDLPLGAVLSIFEKVSREIAQFENHQLATPFGCEFFRPSLSLA